MPFPHIGVAAAPQDLLHLGGLLLEGEHPDGAVRERFRGGLAAQPGEGVVGGLGKGDAERIAHPPDFLVGLIDDNEGNDDQNHHHPIGQQVC